MWPQRIQQQRHVAGLSDRGIRKRRAGAPPDHLAIADLVRNNNRPAFIGVMRKRSGGRAFPISGRRHLNCAAARERSKQLRFDSFWDWEPQCFRISFSVEADTRDTWRRWPKFFRHGSDKLRSAFFRRALALEKEKPTPARCVQDPVADRRKMDGGCSQRSTL